MISRKGTVPFWSCRAASSDRETHRLFDQNRTILLGVIVQAVQKILSSSGRATRRWPTHFSIRRGLPARPEPENTFWTASKRITNYPYVIRRACLKEVPDGANFLMRVWFAARWTKSASFPVVAHVAFYSSRSSLPGESPAPRHEHRAAVPG